MILISVGTECRPSATTFEVEMVERDGVGKLTLRSRRRSVPARPKPGLQNVFGLPSNANTARALRSPGNRSFDPMTAPPKTSGPPRRESMTLSGMRAETRAVPLRENDRAVGSQNVAAHRELRI